ncbi:hypothetical protein PTSG_07486 [Salpingoeca rosetta]|uniref:Uncharacterized protein n=1 Tax=Salpingoeca rosetta (strain ATCC 50818 / BSB-021) TaxID=946362 RepID=F2UIV4_SALR5|nr:uncharacterized protein PTSG_07486 [Salpingoeca rosetta]EGD77153.1 hypothetical protein PTSG_07486 [Salpingoeca rosetta]|eukprot:XP_004990992.1 hypothetical protein PTSG_07486 [Salpingoeca rosetta]
MMRQVDPRVAALACTAIMVMMMAATALPVADDASQQQQDYCIQGPVSFDVQVEVTSTLGYHCQSQLAQLKTKVGPKHAITNITLAQSPGFPCWQGNITLTQIKAPTKLGVGVTVTLAGLGQSLPDTSCNTTVTYRKCGNTQGSNWKLHLTASLNQLDVEPCEPSSPLLLS